MPVVNKKKRLLSELGLLIAAVFWGGAFVVMKNALDIWPITGLLCFRFIAAALCLLPFVWKNIRKLNRSAILGSILAGGFVFLAYLTQTIGLTTTSAGNNAFITAFYVVLVPLFQWGVRRIFPGMQSIAAAFMCLCGIGLIAVGSGFSVGTGDLWTLLCGVMFGAHVVLVSHYTDKGVHVMAFSTLQFLFTGLFAGAAALISEPLPPINILFNWDTAIAFLYLVLPATAFAFSMQNVSLKYAPPGHAVLLMSMEAPFGCLFGVIFLQEQLSPRFFLGAGLILGAILLSELYKRKKYRPLHPGG